MRVRYLAAYNEDFDAKVRMVIRRHRVCERCMARWSTVQPPEKFERLEVQPLKPAIPSTIEVSRDR